MILGAGYLVIATKLQEAATALSHGDIRSRLSDTLGDKMRGTGNYGYVTDVYGDDESGDVVYSHNGGMKKAGYQMGTANGKPSCDIDCDNAVDVMPRTTYDEQADDEDHYAAMEAAKLYKSKDDVPLYERFISKGERKAAAGGSFAGKGKSFPILKAADVMAAVRSIGRAGSDNYDAGTLKRNIIRIAKEKGFSSELPKAWQSDGADAKESIRERQVEAAQVGPINLVESAATTETIVLKEARADYEIKLIAPGKGSSAFYPKEVLQRDGPKVFKANTHVYVNHPTMAEEAARPEGDVKNLAGVLTTDAVYHESHAKGPGLYARMKVFADHGQMVEEKAPHVGMSIRASGVAESGKVREGVPVLKELTSAESVDVVTKAGAGGMILTEAAKPANPTQEAEMTAEEVQKLVEASIRTARLPEDARTEAHRLLETVALKPETKAFIVDTVLRGTIPVKEGALDKAALAPLVVAEAQRIGKLLAVESGGAQVRGMGIGTVAPPTLKPEEIAAREAAAKNEEAEAIACFEALGMSKRGAEFAAKGRAA